GRYFGKHRERQRKRRVRRGRAPRRRPAALSRGDHYGRQGPGHSGVRLYLHQEGRLISLPHSAGSTAACGCICGLVRVSDRPGHPSPTPNHHPPTAQRPPVGEVTATANGTKALYLGGKRALTEQKGWLAATVVIPQMTVPTGSGEVTAGRILPGVNVDFGWEVIKDVFNIELLIANNF